jgi:3-phosphoshikimate 1-carboxyvinyltransferase
MGPDGVRVRGGQLTGCELDLNATPDALPMLAVGRMLRPRADPLGERASVPVEGNRPHRRDASRTDPKWGRRSRGADGLVIEESDLRSATVEGHYDHRVVMALAVAATAISGQTWITTAEAVAVTFPTFLAGMSALGGKLRMASDEAQLS